MHFECPSCHQRLEIDNDRAGELLACPACEGTIRVPKAPVVIRKGLHARSGVRLVPIPAASRQYRQGSLAARVAAIKAAQAPPTDTGKDDPILL